MTSFRMKMKKNIAWSRAFLGVCLACLSQTALSHHAYAKESDVSGQALLFAPQRDDYPEPETVEPASGTEVAEPVIEDAVSTAIEAEVTEATGSPEVFSPEDPVDLLADRVEYDETAGIVSAVGNVELVQSDRILRAEKISYNIGGDKVTANGSVVLNDITGDTYFADNLELKDKMKSGFVRGLNGVLADGSRFTADEAEKIEDIKVVMRNATYTACEPCKKDPERAPIWQLRAKKVTQHKDEQRISYEDARLEVAGVPVAYTPYFSHPDGTVERKSGFLNPSVGFNSDLGAFYQQEYYWDIAPNKDATIGSTIMTEELPLLYGEYRQRFEDAELELDGGVTHSSRINNENNTDVRIEKKTRGHLFGEARWDINDKWRAGSEIALVSDKQYLRQYDISNEDVLENNVYVERFSHRDYATGRLIRFKDLRTSTRADDQPDVLPELYSRFLGAPNDFLGGRWSFEASALGLHREGNDQDMARGTTEIGWQRRLISNIGLVSTFDVNARGDVYKVEDRDIADGTGRSQSSSALRGFTSVNLKTGYPIAKNFDTTQMVFEPQAAITAGSNLNPNNDIPNEDSQDVFLDATNIFNSNRFPGYDRIEDDVHATYGLRTGLYKNNGYQGEVFFGQSYRFDDNDDNPFPDGSGLSNQKSDFVGNISAQLGPKFRLNYGAQLESETLVSRRHEVDARAQVGDITLNTRYFYANALQGTDLDTSREQIRAHAKYKFTDNWAVFGGTQYDLAEETEGLRRLSYGLDYQGQCVNFLVSGRRTLTTDSSGDSGTEIMMRIGLKNLGQFETSALTVGGTDD